MPQINPPLVMPTRPNLRDSDVAGFLATIYKSHALASIARFLCLDRLHISEFEGYAGQAEASDESQFLVKKYYDYNPAVVLNLVVDRDLAKLAIFQGDDGIFQVFVECGMIPGPVKPTPAPGPWPFPIPFPLATPLLFPYQTAALLAGAIRNGLATRLLLERYKRQVWDPLGINSNGTPGSGPPLNLTITNAGTGAPGYSPVPCPYPIATPSNPLLAAVTITQCLYDLTRTMWDSKNWTGTDYVTALSNLTDPMLPGIGILMGWIAGDVLAAGTEYDSVEPVFWQWFNSKFTTKELGTVVGSTLCYLSGFLRCERTVALMTQGQTDPGPELSTPVIFANLAQHCYRHTSATPCEQDPVFTITNAFYAMVVNEFYVSQPKANLAGLANYQAFMVGFEAGLTQGAEAMFASTFAKAYTLGYLSGFRDGYAQGYAAGYKVGYAAGYAAGTPSWIQDLNKIMGDVGTAMSAVKNITSILGAADTVGTIIADVFAVAKPRRGAKKKGNAKRAARHR